MQGEKGGEFHTLCRRVVKCHSTCDIATDCAGEAEEVE